MQNEIHFTDTARSKSHRLLTENRIAEYIEKRNGVLVRSPDGQFVLSLDPAELNHRVNIYLDQVDDGILVITQTHYHENVRDEYERGSWSELMRE